MLATTQPTRLRLTKERRYLALRAPTPFPGTREAAPLHRRWLAGAHRYLRRPSSLSLLPDYRRFRYGRAHALRRPRRRFPGLGRRRHTYDSFLGAFLRKTAPAYLRRAAPLRFPSIRPLLSAARYKRRAVTTELDGR